MSNLGYNLAYCELLANARRSEEFLAQVRGLVGPDIEVTYLQRQPAVETTFDGPLVGAMAAVPTLLTRRLSPPMRISAPGVRLVVLRRLTVVAPAAAGAARPELARPRR